MSTLLILVSGINNTLDNAGQPGAAAKQLDHSLQWVLTRKDQTVVYGEASGHSVMERVEVLAGETSRVESIVLVIPSEQVLMLTCKVPGRSIGQIRQALPYALEEFVAADIESVHIAAGPIKSGQPINCALIDDGLMATWKSWLTNHQIEAEVMVCQAQLASAAINDCTVFANEDLITVVHDQTSATFEREELIGVLESFSFERLIFVGGTLTQLEKSQLDAALQIDERLDETLYLAERAAETKPINLFQGKYTVENTKRGLQSHYSTLGKLAALWVLVYIAGLGAQGGWMSYQADQLAEESRSSYTEMFPQDSIPITVTQLRRRFESKLKVRPSSEDLQISQFVPLLSGTGLALASKGTIQAFSYNQDKEEMTIEIVLRNYDQVEQIQGELEKRGVTSEMISAGSVESGINARLKASFLQ